MQGDNKKWIVLKISLSCPSKFFVVVCYGSIDGGSICYLVAHGKEQ
jgi:hypothetical protein